MPFKWTRNNNPYAHNSFSVLRVGPNTPKSQIVAQSTKLKQKLSVSEQQDTNECPLNEHSVNQAAKCLQNAPTLAEELLLVHAQPRKEQQKNRKRILDALEKEAVLTAECAVPKLSDPEAVFWFIPMPDPKSINLPVWNSLNLGEPGDQADMALDILFDV